MAEVMEEKLNALDPALLAEIVRMDQNNPSFEIKEWSVKRLSDKGITNPDGLWLFNGIGNDGKRSRPWSVVLKIIQSHEQELPPSAPNHWKRELWAINSGFLEALHGPVKTPRFYRVEE